MKIALKAIKDAGLIAVCNFAIPRGDKTREGHSAEDACKMMVNLRLTLTAPPLSA